MACHLIKKPFVGFDDGWGDRSIQELETNKNEKCFCGDWEGNEPRQHLTPWTYPPPGLFHGSRKAFNFSTITGGGCRSNLRSTICPLQKIGVTSCCNSMFWFFRMIHGECCESQIALINMRTHVLYVGKYIPCMDPMRHTDLDIYKQKQCISEFPPKKKQLPAA